MRALHALMLLSGGLGAVVLADVQQVPFHPAIPKVWDDAAVATLDLPLAQPDRSPRYMTSTEYYALKIRPIYKAYPAYAKGREPAGYLDSLKQKEPEVVFDATKLHTREDWIEAGKLVFESEIQFFPAPKEMPPAGTTAPFPVTPDGKLSGLVPGFRYYIRKKGVLEAGVNSCAGCHTRVMADGTLVPGGQGVASFTLPDSVEFVQKSTPEQYQRGLDFEWVVFGAPWSKTKAEFERSLPKEEYIRILEAQHAGTFPRQGTSLSHPVHVPALFGVADRAFLDATGLVRNRSIGDLMRYAAINQGLDTLAHYGDFQPSPHATSFSGDEGTRYSDEQLYALMLYVESLQPPPNPNPVDARAERGRKIFAREGCATCHTPPLYTNNKLTPVEGFLVPDALQRTGMVMNARLGTDPTLALETRRGTGFYKVPSLRGVWLRNAFGHDGKAETLEEWFDPTRLEADYVPKGYHLGPGPILGHEKGLDLSPEDKTALIAFLKTL